MATLGMDLAPEHEAAYRAIRAVVTARPPVDDGGDVALIAAHAFLARVRAVRPRGSFLTVAEAARAVGVNRGVAEGHARVLRRRGLWPYLDPPRRFS